MYGGYDAIDDQGIWGRERKGQDCFGHGTLVASIAGGKTYGVAPGAMLRSIRVLPCNKMGTVVRMMKGLDYIIAQKKANPGRKVILAQTRPVNSTDKVQSKKKTQSLMYYIIIANSCYLNIIRT